jgi:hypothetical protein
MASLPHNTTMGDHYDRVVNDLLRLRGHPAPHMCGMVGYSCTSRRLLNAYKYGVMPDAEVRCETVLRASLLGISAVFPKSTAFSRMFTRVAKDMCRKGGRWPWATSVCDRVCTVVQLAIDESPRGSDALLTGMVKVLGAFVSTQGPVGALCARLLSAGLAHLDVITDAHHHLVEFALCSGKRLRAYNARVPESLVRHVGPAALGVHLGVACARLLNHNLLFRRVRACDLLDALFELACDTRAFADAIVSASGYHKTTVRTALAPWLEWPCSLRCAWLTACVGNPT